MATGTAPRLTDIEAARAGSTASRASRRSTLGDVLAARRPPRLAQSREPAAHRLVQGPRRGQQDLAAHRGRAAAGVVAASAGNHGQAVAWAAREAGIPATVFMPQDAPMAKVEATKNYGARVELGGGTSTRRSRRRSSTRGDRRDVRARVRGRARDRGPGDDRARARRAGAGDRRRSSSRSAAAAWRRGSRWRCGSCGRRRASSACRPRADRAPTIADGIAVKGRASSPARSSRACSTTSSRSATRRSARRSCSCSSARSSSWRARGGRRRGGAGGRGRRRGTGCALALRRQHRPDDPDLGDAPRADAAGRYLVVRRSLATGPASCSSCSPSSPRSG